MPIQAQTLYLHPNTECHSAASDNIGIARRSYEKVLPPLFQGDETPLGRAACHRLIYARQHQAPCKLDHQRRDWVSGTIEINGETTIQDPCFPILYLHRIIAVSKLEASSTLPIQHIKAEKLN